MADKFGLNGEVRELKIGRTFEKNSASSGSSAFHTVRYDFKPASVDSSRDGVLNVDENKSVSITVPHLHGNGHTNFSGRVKNANPKECILIIDRETGEITIETLSSQILVKKTRQERELPGAAAGSLTPTSTSSSAPPPPSRPQMPIERAKPPAPPTTRPTPQPAPQAAMHDSNLPVFLGLPPQPEVKAAPTEHKAKIGHVKPVGSNSQAKSGGQMPIAAAPAVLSDSSSSSDSSSDDSSSSDSGSDNEDDKPTHVAMSMPSFGGPAISQVALPQNLTAAPPPSMPSFSLPSKPAPQQVRAPAPTMARATPPQRAPTAAISMPQFLNDDLQLSESEEDSD